MDDPGLTACRDRFAACRILVNISHFDALIDDGESTIVVDFSSVDFVSSAGLRVLLATAKKIGTSGSLRLFGLNPSVREVFDVSGFSTIFAIFDDEPSALAG